MNFTMLFLIEALTPVYSSGSGSTIALLARKYEMPEEYEERVLKALCEPHFETEEGLRVAFVLHAELRRVCAGEAFSGDERAGARLTGMYVICTHTYICIPSCGVANRCQRIQSRRRRS
jgi:hypothetical protein